MNASLAVSWGFRRITRSSLAITVAVIVATTMLPGIARANGPLVDVVIRKHAAADQRPEHMVRLLGGDVGRVLGIIDGFAARVPERALPLLRSSAGVRAVSLDETLQPLHVVDGFDAEADGGSMYNTTRYVRAHDLWRVGITGRGVDVALIDSGVVPVNGLTQPGKVVNGPDLSFESQAPHLRHLDTYGHGTHMAGIIAGADDGSADDTTPNHDSFSGVAPDARIVNLKVAESSGATDVSQVIAAIDWVVQHRDDPGMNIRVLNLSFGSDGIQHHIDDPLSYAVEVAWRKGIVVVVAAGNGGAMGLTNPARNPFVIAVGANDPQSTRSTWDDTVPSWSARGNGTRDPDVVAPGRSIVSLRDPGSYIDTFHPNGRVADRFFRGSGTSQAAAAVAGSAALLLQQRPGLTPDQVKALLTRTANWIPSANSAAQGAGMINVRAASLETPPGTSQQWQRGTGFGTLEGARGSSHVAMDGVELTGEQDIFGAAWNGRLWAAAALKENSWTGGQWNGSQWAGADWSGSSWSSITWSSVSWSSNSWSGSSWSSASWSSVSWSGSSWSTSSWSWSASSWSSASWSSSTWSNSFWG